MPAARFVRVKGVVQGVGFRPFVYRLAQAHGISGWVRNSGDGVEIHAEGEEAALDAFVRDLAAEPPPASRVVSLLVTPAQADGGDGFEIRDSDAEDRHPTVRISPDHPGASVHIVLQP